MIQKAAIYCRISMDREGEGLGVERQLEDCRQLCEDRGFHIVGVYQDNDVSAFSGVKRPEFERMLADRDHYETVVVWKSDRLARRGKDLQRFLDTGATLTSCTEPEFTGSTGLLMLRILAGFAEHESGVKSERITRKMKQKAQAGDPHAGGKRAFGFDITGRTVVDEEAKLIQEAARRILAGETLTAVCLDWQRAGVVAPGGGQWKTSNISRMLRSARLAGLREYHGELLQGSWPAVLDRPTWDRLRAALGQRKRRTGHRWVLTGVLYCGRCGAPMAGGNTTGSGQVTYRCQSVVNGGCGKVSIAVRRVEDYVIPLVLDAIPALNVESEDIEPIMADLRAAEADQAQLAKDHYVAKLISRPVFLAANDELEDRIRLIRRKVAEAASGPVLDHVSEQWGHRSISWRQSVLRTVLERIDVAPASGTRQPVSERITLVWRA